MLLRAGRRYCVGSDPGGSQEKGLILFARHEYHGVSALLYPLIPSPCTKSRFRATLSLMQPKTGSIQQLVSVCEQVFVLLQIPVSSEELEELAITIHRSMSIEARHFHTPQHVLHLANASDPIQSLAALFHDIVYYQVDRGFSPEIYHCVSPYILEVEGEIWLVEAQGDRLFRITMELFGLSPGQKLSLYAGSNEFLSALVMAKRLEKLVPEKILLQAIAYIEATIPFRGKDANNNGPFEVLAQRLSQIRQAYQIPMKDAEIEDTLCGAVIFANGDVDSFAEKDTSMFLDGTWKLLPETNETLRSGRIYSIKEYRRALEKMAGFLGYLNPDNVFHTYKGVPPEVEFREMVRLAYQNITTAREYLSIKLLAIAILEAMADLTGGDAPLSLFTGDIQHNGYDTHRYDNFLPLPDIHPDLDQSSVLYRLLDSGRASETDFDMRNSPLAFFMYSQLPREQITPLLTEAKEMFAGNLKPRAFLQKFGASLVVAVAQACAATVMTRQEKLNQIAQEFQVSA
jgi:hypothetical protein